VPRLLGKLLDRKTSDASSRSGTNGNLQSVTTSLILVVIGGGCASFLRTTTLTRAEDSTALRIRKQVFESLLMLTDLEWYQTVDVPELKVSTKAISKDGTPIENEEASKLIASKSRGITPAAIGSILNEDVAIVAHTITGNVADMFRYCCSCIFGTYNMLHLNPSLFGISVGIVPVIGVAAMVLRKFVKNIATKQRHISSLAASFVEERLTHLAMVKMSNRELYEIEQYARLQDESRRLSAQLSIANGAFMGFIFAASSGALFMVFNEGGKAVASGRMTSGELTSFATYTFLLGLGTSGIFKTLSSFTRGMVSASRVYHLIDAAKEERKVCKITPSDNTPDKKSANSISLKNVEFAYKSNPNSKVLNGISLTLQRGKITCLVGKNGSGKSTIASLLAALYKPLSGSIVLADGTDYSDLNREEQKQIIQVVPQTPALFNTSVLDNVLYSNPSASIDDAVRAMELANCGFVANLQGGHSHVVGLNGCKLSGGQRQRVCIARAFLSDPCILVLDEPMSALDNEGEAAILDAVAACRKSPGRALLLITHRIKSLELADEVLVLSHGQIIEKGKFEELKSNQDSALCQLMPDLT
jgi:ABC-type multidrug transport system fused ATPase/permease subunit